MIHTYYNWGRWVVRCSNNNCIGAIRLERGQRYAYCTCIDVDICQHGVPCGSAFEVGWPDQPELVEALLVDRPVGNRNWYPTETLEDLRLENVEHGV